VQAERAVLTIRSGARGEVSVVHAERAVLTIRSGARGEVSVVHVERAVLTIRSGARGEVSVQRADQKSAKAHIDLPLVWVSCPSTNSQNGANGSFHSTPAR
jgi:hypothetical protein